MKTETLGQFVYLDEFDVADLSFIAPFRVLHWSLLVLETGGFYVCRLSLN